LSSKFCRLKANTETFFNDFDVAQTDKEVDYVERKASIKTDDQIRIDISLSTAFTEEEMCH